MKKNDLTLIIALLFVAFLLMGASGTTKVKDPTRAPVSGFSKEIDEPSARGQLIRISPEQNSVANRFDVSPDGKHLVYSAVQAGGSERIYNLWRINTDGKGSPFKITSGGDSHYFYPSYTSDGQYIVYVNSGQLWRVRADGTGGKMRIPGSGNDTDSAPHLSKDDKLVFSSSQASSSSYRKHLIWICNLDGGQLTQIREGSNPRWCPDGETIVFEHEGDVMTVRADGTQLMQLTNTSRVYEALPSFSKDGKKIVYTSNEGKDGNTTANWNIWYMDIDGSNKTQLTELNCWDSWPIWGDNGIYFLSARAQIRNERTQRIWFLKLYQKLISDQ